MGKNNLTYKGCIVWVNDHGYFCALGGLQADTIDGIKRLINDKITKESKR